MRLPLAATGTPSLRRMAGEARAGVAAFAAVTREHGSLLRGLVRGDEVRVLEHYPPGDVVDVRRGSQFFYHCHRGGRVEHGHLHLFWHATAGGRRRYTAREPRSWVRTAPAHLLAIGLDARGLPVSMFTVNRWVTGGPWFDAERTAWMLQRFALGALPGQAHACAFVTHFVRLYLPLARCLLHARDERVATLARDRPRQDVLEDRSVELLSRARLDWPRDLDRLERACAAA